MDRPSVWQVIFERDEKKKSGEKKKEKLFFTREFSGAVTQRLKRILSSRFLRFTKRVSEAIAQTSTRVYGTMLLCFGIVGVLMHYLHLSIDQDIASPIVGIVLSVLSIPLLLSDKALPIFMQDFKPTDFLFFEFFCMKRHSFIENRRSIPTFVAMLIGFIPAVMSAFIPFWMVALIIGVVIGVYIGMESPEFIFLLSLISLPYLRFLPGAEMVFGIAILLAVISFARKVLYGRRVLYIEQYDFVIGAMLLFILVSGIFIKGEDSFSGSIRMIVLALGYMLAGNIITNRRLAELMNGCNNSNVRIEEIHHTQKKDAPSGTALTLAQEAIARLDRKTRWNCIEPQKGETSNATADSIEITSLREGTVPGTHTVTYESEDDTLVIKHTLKSRSALATGAVIAAEFICGKSGVFTMDDLFKE